MTNERDTSSDQPSTGPGGLAEIRARIDAIDTEMHALLIERSTVIDSLIKVKGADRTGAAFRPGREAAMMHRFADRHTGSLPLTTVENLWREIISTFTYLQAPYRVHIPTDGDLVAIHDSLRFYFGFTVPYAATADARATITAVAASRSDLGLLSLGTAASAWWEDLGENDGPRIISRLPFFACEGRPAAMPTVVISRPLDEQVEPERRCWTTRWPAVTDPAGTLADADVEILATCKIGEAVCALLAGPADRDASAMKNVLAGAGCDGPPRAVGGYAAPLAISETVPVPAPPNASA